MLFRSDVGYLDRFIKSVSVGKSIDGTINKSDTLSTAFADHMEGDASFVEDAKELLAGVGNASGGAKDAALTALIAKLMQRGESGQQLAAALNSLTSSKS